MAKIEGFRIKNLVVSPGSVVEASGSRKSSIAQGNDSFYRAQSRKLKPVGIIRLPA